MKKTILSLAAAAVLLLASCEENNSKIYQITFENGEILLPDMAHDDTLVVVNARYLNVAFRNTDITTDMDISDILRKGAIPLRKK